MKNVVKLFTVVLVVAIVCAFAACKGSQGESGRSAEYIVVTFNLDGGEIEGRKTNPSFKVLAGGPIQKPSEDPAKEKIWTEDETAIDTVAGLYRTTASGKISHTFAGWYNGNTPWAFNFDTSSSDIILTARWSEPESIPEVPVNNITSAIEYIAAHPGTYRMRLNSSTNATLSLAGGLSIPSGGHLILEGAPGVVTLNRSAVGGPLFTLNKPFSNLTIGSNIKLAGNNAVGGTYGYSVVRVESNAGFNMEGNSEISGNTNIYYVNDYSASAVFVDGGTFTMKGTALITNNNSTSYTTITLAPAPTGGVLPTGAWYGGTVILNGGGTFNMDGGRITSNTAYAGRGIAVNVINGKFTMGGGEISSNTAGTNSTYTAAVFIAGNNNTNASARFEMSGGSITGSATTGTNPVRHDVLVFNTATAGSAGSITLSGAPTIGQLTLNAANATSTTFITIAYPGMLGSANITLNLRGEVGGAASPNGVFAFWTNGTRILQSGSGYSVKQDDVSKFVFNDASSNMYGSGVAALDTSTMIPDNWSISNTGLLVR